MRAFWARRRLSCECAVYSNSFRGNEFVRASDTIYPLISYITSHSAVKYQMKLHAGTLKAGDVLMSNSPQAGGSSVPIFARSFLILTCFQDTSLTSLLSPRYLTQKPTKLSSSLHPEVTTRTSGASFPDPCRLLQLQFLRKGRMWRASGSSMTASLTRRD